MHCDRKDISKWNKTKKLRKQSKLRDLSKKVKPLINSLPLDTSKKTIIVVKKNGTIIKIDK